MQVVNAYRVLADRENAHFIGNFRRKVGFDTISDRRTMINATRTRVCVTYENRGRQRVTRAGSVITEWVDVKNVNVTIRINF